MRGLLAVSLLMVTVLGGGCFDFEGLSSGLGVDLAVPDLAAPADLASADLTDRALLPCPPSAACQDFEQLIGPPWSYNAGTGDSAVAAGGAAHGGSLYMSDDADGVAITQYATVEYQLGSPLAAGTLYVRFWLRAPANPGYPLYVIVAAGPQTVSAGVKNGAWRVSQDSGLTDYVSSVAFQPDVWTCVRLRVDLADGSGDLVLDGNAPFAFGPNSGPTPVSATHVPIGLARAETPATPSHADVDDVAIDLLPLACP